jgi:hypothetical protein
MSKDADLASPSKLLRVTVRKGCGSYCFDPSLEGERPVGKKADAVLGKSWGQNERRGLYKLGRNGIGYF